MPARTGLTLHPQELPSLDQRCSVPHAAVGIVRPTLASCGPRARRARRGQQRVCAAARSAHARRAQTLRAPELAGVACALVAAEAVSKPHISAAYEPSAAVVAAVQALEPARSALFDLQADAGVHVPLGVDLRLAGARGAPSPPAPPPARCLPALSSAGAGGSCQLLNSHPSHRDANCVCIAGWCRRWRARPWTLPCTPDKRAGTGECMPAGEPPGARAPAGSLHGKCAARPGVVEAWAAGGTWAQVTADSNLDDGDVARLLGRAADLLRQARPAAAAPPRCCIGVCGDRACAAAQA